MPNTERDAPAAYINPLSIFNSVQAAHPGALRSGWLDAHGCLCVTQHLSHAEEQWRLYGRHSSSIIVAICMLLLAHCCAMTWVSGLLHPTLTSLPRIKTYLQSFQRDPALAASSQLHCCCHATALLLVHAQRPQTSLLKPHRPARVAERLPPVQASAAHLQMQELLQLLSQRVSQVLPSELPWACSAPAVLPAGKCSLSATRGCGRA